MATTVYFVRHGENPANVTREFSHQLVDYSLTPLGVAQARQTAAYFAGRPLAAVYSSPLKRARETAEIIAGTRYAVEIVEEFREVNVGSLEGTPPTDETWAFHDGIFAAWRAGEATARFPDGEDHVMLLARMRRGLAQVTRDHAGQEVVVVAHGGILAATINEVCPEARLEEIIHIPNCAVTILEIDCDGSEARGVLRAWAECAHLA